MPANYTQPDGSVVPVSLAAAFAIVARGSFTRPANTTAYASGQLVANNTTAGSVVPLAIDAARIPGSTGLIARAALAKSGTTITNASFRVHLFRADPTSAVGDAGSYSTSGALDAIGYFDITMDQAYTDGAKGWAAPAVGNAVVFDAPSGSKTIYALIEARGAYTPVSGETFTLELEVLQN